MAGAMVSAATQPPPDGCVLLQVEVPPLQAVAASRRPKSSMSSRSRLSGSVSATTTARERSAQIRMLETELHARSAAGQRLAATAKLSTIKSAYAAMKRDDKRKYV